MSYFIRKVSNKRHFDKARLNECCPSYNDVPADTLTDLHTKGNKLSVFLVRDTSNDVNRVLCAIGATRDNFSNIDYVLLDETKLKALAEQYGIVLDYAAPGDTPDDLVNQWHVDLASLTGSNLSQLALSMVLEGEKSRKLDKKIKILIKESYARQNLNKACINPKLLEKLENPSA